MCNINYKAVPFWMISGDIVIQTHLEFDAPWCCVANSVLNALFFFVLDPKEFWHCHRLKGARVQFQKHFLDLLSLCLPKQKQRSILDHVNLTITNDVLVTSKKPRQQPTFCLENAENNQLIFLLFCDRHAQQHDENFSRSTFWKIGDTTLLSFFFSHSD